MSGYQTPSSNTRHSDGSDTESQSEMNMLPWHFARRPLFFTLVAASALAGIMIMAEIMRPNGTTLLEKILLVLFAISFSWIAVSFWSAVIGFILQMFKLDPYSLKRQAIFTTDQPLATRTAVIMPIYNEQTQRVIAGFESTIRSVAATGDIAHFDFFLLSDTRKADIADAELGAWKGLQQRLGNLGEQVFYRRREHNTERKVGNLKDFCQRWGSQYEHMLVMDADSVMTGECIVKLAKAMQANPNAGLIQTVPIPVRQHTFFGRFLQFAAVLYSPMLATGLAFWQTNAANYWGHNAILRTRVFMAHCGLPHLDGKAPFGGDILSHDFVEAALMRRAGWDVLLWADLDGSYEEVPSNILDYATRDRRWVQGNIQHLGLLGAKGLHPVSRMHFLCGALAYISSLIWMLMISLSTIDAIGRSLNQDVYFSGPQLFPDWQVARVELISWLLYMTIGLLILPKALGLIVALVHRREAFGGAATLLKGALLESFTAFLIAPVMMVFHAYFVICVFIGRSVSWEAQNREGYMISWKQATQRTIVASMVAMLWGAVTWYFSPAFFWWMTPVLVGLILAPALVRYTSSPKLGVMLRERNVFIIPAEAQEVTALTQVTDVLANEPTSYPQALVPALPQEVWRDMPVQRFDTFDGKLALAQRDI